jgi:hypothetical protein
MYERKAQTRHEASAWLSTPHEHPHSGQEVSSENRQQGEPRNQIKGRGNKCQQNDEQAKSW